MLSGPAALTALGPARKQLLTFMLAFAVWIGARSARSGNGFGGAVVSV